MKIIYMILLSVIFNGLSAQNSDLPLEFDEYLGNNENHPCVSDAQYEIMEKETNENIKKLGLNNISYKTEGFTLLEWPLKPASNMKDCGYYYISAYVDMNKTAGQVQDWNCGSKTYDGHRGIDIVPYPFIWEKMDSNRVEVIAAAAGTIINKADGANDRICNPTGNETNNYIAILHNDGSKAYYIHMKSGSLTSKGVGQTVSAGEFLGIVGSAGVSTGVHLHFEIRSDGSFANYIDPFYGNCNTSIGQTWWKNPVAYSTPELMKVSIHSQWPYTAVCPNTKDTLYEQYQYIANPGQTATFNAFSKSITSGDVWDFKILNPDNSVFTSWSYTSPSTRNTSSLGWFKTLPTNPGTYTYEVSYKNTKCSKTFEISSSVGINELSRATFNVYPNPSEGQINVETNKLSGSTNLIIYNLMGKEVSSHTLVAEKTTIDLKLSSGLYMFAIKDGNTVISNGKIIIK